MADENKNESGGAGKEEQQAPADALSKTPDELDEEQAAKDAANPEAAAAKAAASTEKKVSPLKKFFRKVNLYFLIFLLLVVVVGAITIVNYLNSQKAPVEPTINNQALTQEALKQLANTDATVGGAAQTLTIQGNAVISGQTLMRGNLNIAGNLQTGGSIQGPTLTISGTSNLGTAQISSLQVAQNTALQGTTTMRDLNVAGTSSFSGPMTASQITVTKLILSGSGTLQLPNHLSFTGPSPGRSFIGSGILGGGGTVSVNGSDTSGTISLNSGGGGSGNGCIVRINFQTPFTSTPHVIVSPVNRAAGQLDYYVERNTQGFSLCTDNTPDDNKAFSFDYFVTG
jgi:cytoskeletal protein CcmA (bactofilin family)